jgi:RimJ/RimL family protein N-acetyltransferase
VTGLPVGEPVEIGPPGLRPAPVLEGRDVILRRPRAADDTAPLHAATHGTPEAEAVWTYMGYGPWASAEEMQVWVAGRPESADPHWYTVASAEDDRPLGMATIMNHDAAMRRAELGHIWYVPAAQHTTTNTEAAYLMLVECFDGLGCRRVEWKCDALNERSRAAALRLGFVFEGTFRNHMIVKGRNRDTAWFAMTPDDWSAARPRMEHWLYELDRDAGRPRGPLAG